MKALEVTDLKKTYPNGVEALKGVNVAVEQGDFFALLGPNGAGKSTMIGIITSLVNKTSGQVRVFGYDLETQTEAVKRCIGLVPQEFNFNMFEKVLQITVQQAGYYGIPRKIALERSELYLNQLGLWKKRNDAARLLSGGMKRRLMIARALVHEPRLLILDEPTAGVDIELRRSMWEFLARINEQGITVILTTHYLEEAESLCRNIAIVDKGNVVSNTDMKSLLMQLQTETFVFYLEAPYRQPLALLGFHCALTDELTLVVEVKSGQSLTELFRQLAEKNISVISMRNKANRLEELFLKLTSKE